MRASSAAFFFDRWPALLHPRCDRRRISLAGALFRLLCAPRPALQQLAHVAGMIADAQFAFDQNGDTLAGPQIAAKTVRLSSLPQPCENLALLLGREPRLPATGFALAQRLRTAAVARAASTDKRRPRSPRERRQSDFAASLAHAVPRPAGAVPRANSWPWPTRRKSSAPPFELWTEGTPTSPKCSSQSPPRGPQTQAQALPPGSSEGP